MCDALTVACELIIACSTSVSLFSEKIAYGTKRERYK